MTSSNNLEQLISHEFTVQCDGDLDHELINPIFDHFDEWSLLMLQLMTISASHSCVGLVPIPQTDRFQFQLHSARHVYNTLF